jgi:hypothetical protein
LAAPADSGQQEDREGERRRLSSQRTLRFEGKAVDRQQEGTVRDYFEGANCITNRKVAAPLLATPVAQCHAGLSVTSGLGETGAIMKAGAEKWWPIIKASGIKAV